MHFRAAVRATVALGMLLALAPHAVAEPVDAATRAAARDLGYAGVSAYQAGDFATASTKLEKAYAALQAPSLGLWSARALARLGKLVEASERYVDVTRLETTSGDQAVHEQAKKDARVEHEALAPKIPKLIVRVTGVDPSEVTVTIDGVAMANALIGEKRPVNPGAHVVRGKRGDEVVEGHVTLPQGGEEPVTLAFKGGPLPIAAPGTAPNADGGAGATTGEGSPGARADTTAKPAKSGSTMRTLGWIALVTGGASLVGGGVTGVIALDWQSQIENDDKLFNDENEGRYNTMRYISIGSLVAGGVLAVTGIVLLVAAPSGDSTGKAAPNRYLGVRVGPGSVSVTGTF